jgi:hypothetical protein
LKGPLLWAPTRLLVSAGAVLLLLLITRKLQGIQRWAVVSGSVFFGCFAGIAFGLRHFPDLPSAVKYSIILVGSLASLVAVVWGRAGRLSPIGLILLIAVAALCAAAGYGFEDAGLTRVCAPLHNLDPDSAPYLDRTLESKQLVIPHDGKLRPVPWGQDPAASDDQRPCR